MNRWIHSVILLLALSVAVSSVEAGSVTHNFQSMAGSKLIFSNNFKTGTTSLLTYQCIGSAVFAATTINNYSTICLKMTDSNSEMVSDRPIPNLNSLRVCCYPASRNTNIKVYISKDGVHWGNSLGNYNAGCIDATFPQSDYYIRLTNTGNTTVWIEDMYYTWGDCDCKAVETPDK
jgi:hypothetical protein